MVQQHFINCEILNNAQVVSFGPHVAAIRHENHSHIGPWLGAGECECECDKRQGPIFKTWPQIYPWMAGTCACTCARDKRSDPISKT